jgi:hypothetical protein
LFRYLRIAVLLAILVTVAGQQWLTGNRLSSWEKPLWVTIYPVLIDSDDDIRGYVDSLRTNSFEDINLFLKKQAARYGRQLENTVVFQLAHPLTVLPPALPEENSGVNVALWSLKMRWWVWRNGSQDHLIGDDIRMFVIYQKDNPNGPLERSVGIKNGGYGVVNAVASRREAAHNLIVITHEILHILGAGDKYELSTGQPIAPDGLANPEKSPLYPQDRAEIMGGRIAISGSRWLYPDSLGFCVIGSKTATEIGLRFSQ